MSVETRPYKKKRRAELEEATRLRITEAAMTLHEELGPTRTSISAIAERAGVQRATVYRHFPDEASLFAACSGHWTQQHPLPDLEAWAATEDPDERLRVALTELYAYYAATEQMTEHLLRDEQTNDTVRQLFSAYHGYLAAARDVLMAGRGLRGRRKAARGRGGGACAGVFDVAVVGEGAGVEGCGGGRGDGAVGGAGD